MTDMCSVWWHHDRSVCDSESGQLVQRQRHCSSLKSRPQSCRSQSKPVLRSRQWENSDVLRPGQKIPSSSQRGAPLGASGQGSGAACSTSARRQACVCAQHLHQPEWRLHTQRIPPQSDTKLWLSILLPIAGTLAWPMPSISYAPATPTLGHEIRFTSVEDLMHLQPALWTLQAP